MTWGGEVGRVLSIDLDSQLCLVQFRGRPLPVEVPVRHLRANEDLYDEHLEVSSVQSPKRRKDLGAWCTPVSSIYYIYTHDVTNPGVLGVKETKHVD